MLHATVLVLLFIIPVVYSNFLLITLCACVNGCCDFRYVVNYAPFDLVYKILKFLPIKIIPLLMAELRRVHRVEEAVNLSLKKDADFYLRAVAAGTAYGKFS